MVPNPTELSLVSGIVWGSRSQSSLHQHELAGILCKRVGGFLGDKVHTSPALITTFPVVLRRWYMCQKSAFLLLWGLPSMLDRWWLPSCGKLVKGMNRWALGKPKHGWPVSFLVAGSLLTSSLPKDRAQAANLNLEVEVSTKNEVPHGHPCNRVTCHTTYQKEAQLTQHFIFGFQLPPRLAWVGMLPTAWDTVHCWLGWTLI